MQKLMNCLKPMNHACCGSGALLFLRLVVGIAFLYHGWGKIQHPFAWMPPEAPVPGIFQFLAAISEFGGGIALILGLIMPIAMMGLGFTMGVAVFFHAVLNKDPFVSMGGPSYELALVYFAITMLFLNFGPGKYSLDAKIFGHRA